MESRTRDSSGCSTGRGTRVKYSTSMDWDEWARKKRIYATKYSTGEDARIIHSTGAEFDKSAKESDRKEYEDNEHGGAKHPGFTYKSYRKQDESQSANDNEIPPKPLKKVIIYY